MVRLRDKRQSENRSDEQSKRVRVEELAVVPWSGPSGEKRRLDVANYNEWFALLGLKLHDTRKDKVHISSVGGRTDFARQRDRWQVGATMSLAPHVQLHRFQATNCTPPQASGTLLIDLTWRVVVMGGTYHPCSSQGECK